ncbi:hypothetical protein CYLTODRAFT_489092 [Cylindrobasidium torrendii FP15055 ss-10]|uniref:Uncharacterized protein n=1 Tax=Cylindrobasidium torrendii FP15055 ss-10 TaxID=1314674 RepID=A0A0D7BFA0_9AGAR|nr:hypothetical protein CYLTODRAFT_489092 [Cylindrobasidium torrendii FP15055 ss-10]
MQPMSTSNNPNQEWEFSTILGVRGYSTCEFPHYKLRWAPASNGQTWNDSYVHEKDLASPRALKVRNEVWAQIKAQRPDLKRSDFCWKDRRITLSKEWIEKTEAEFYRSSTVDSDSESDLTSLSDSEGESLRLQDASASGPSMAHPRGGQHRVHGDRNSPGSVPDEYAIHAEQRQPSPNLTQRSPSSQPTEFTVCATSPIHPTSSTSLQKLLSDSALRGYSTDSDVDMLDDSHNMQVDLPSLDNAELPLDSDAGSTLLGHWSGSLHIMLPPSETLVLGAFSISFPSMNIPSHKGTLFEDKVLALEIHNLVDVDQVLWLAEPPSYLVNGLLSPAPGNNCPDIPGFAATLHLCQILVATPLGMVTLPGYSEPFRPMLFIRWSPDASMLSHGLLAQIAFFPLPKSLPKTLASAYACGIFETPPSSITFTVSDFSSLELLALHALCWPVWLHDYLRTAKSTLPLDVIVFTGSGEPSQQVAFEADIILKILEKYNVRILDDSAMDDPSIDIVFVHYDLLSSGGPLPPSSLRWKYSSRRHIAYGHLSSAIRPPFHACVEDTSIIWKAGGIITLTPDVLRYKSVLLDRILRKLDGDDAWKVILATHVFGHTLAEQQTGDVIGYDELISDIRTEKIELVRTSLTRNGVPDGPLRLFNAKDIGECCLADNKTFKTRLEVNSNTCNGLAEDDPWGLKTELKRLQSEIWRSKRYKRFVVLCSHRDKILDDTLEVLTCEAFIESL